MKEGEELERLKLARNIDVDFGRNVLTVDNKKDLTVTGNLDLEDHKLLKNRRKLFEKKEELPGRIEYEGEEKIDPIVFTGERGFRRGMGGGQKDAGRFTTGAGVCQHRIWKIVWKFGN